MTATITDRGRTKGREPLVLNRNAYLRSSAAEEPLSRSEVRNRVIAGGQRIYGNVNVGIESLMSADGYEAAEKIIVEALIGDVAVVPRSLVFDTTGQSKSWWDCGIFLQVRVDVADLSDSFAELGIHNLDEPFNYLDTSTGRNCLSMHTHVGRKLPHPNPRHQSHTSED